MVMQINNYWDLESVPVFKDVNIDLILCALVNELNTLGHEGEFAMSSFVGKFDRIGRNTRLGLMSNGIRVFSAKSGKSQSADNLLKRHAREWAETRPDGVFVLVSSDRDYMHLMREMRELNLDTLLVYYKGKIGRNLRFYPEPHADWEEVLDRVGAFGHEPVIPEAKTVADADALGAWARTAGPVCAGMTPNIVWSSVTSSVDAETVGRKRGIAPNEGGGKRRRRGGNYFFN